jgi:hypothetical protein
VTSWLITSFGLPVATTAGRLIVVASTGLSRNPLGAVTATAVSLVGAASGLMLAHRRRQRALRRGSIS